MAASTIKIFLVHGDAKRLRTAEISNWSGKALAAPRTELPELLERDELRKPGVYVLLGQDPDTGKALCYVGEAEVIRDRLRQHKTRDDWSQAIAFVSKDENLTKAHIRFLEGRLISEATATGRVAVSNSQASGASLPESDQADMEIFLQKMRQLLPVLGSDLITPVVQPSDPKDPGEVRLVCEIKGLRGYGKRTAGGFVVFHGSQAVSVERPSAAARHPFVLALRQELLESGVLVQANGYLQFTRDAEFSSPSAAAAVIQGGGANGLTSWRTEAGQTLKELEQ
jgi:hypothetical protein